MHKDRMGCEELSAVSGTSEDTMAYKRNGSQQLETLKLILGLSNSRARCVWKTKGVTVLGTGEAAGGIPWAERCKVSGQREAMEQDLWRTVFV